MAEIRWYWPLAAASVAFRLALVFCFTDRLNLGSRPEVATPLTSLRRLAEGYWLKQSSMSPYSGSMYHGSPLLLSILGPLTMKRIDGQSAHIFCSLICMIVDLLTAMLIRATGQRLFAACCQNMQLPKLAKADQKLGNLNTGELASLIFLWNPSTIITCVGSSTSPIENLMVVLAIYGACSRRVPLAAFGWVMATHLSLYPAILIVPVILLLGSGLANPPPKLFLLEISSGAEKSPSDHVKEHKVTSQTGVVQVFSWRLVVSFVLWASIWSCYVLFLSTISLKGYDGLFKMFRKNQAHKDKSPQAQRKYSPESDEPIKLKCKS